MNEAKQRRIFSAICLIVVIVFFSFYKMQNSSGNVVSMGVDDEKVGIAVNTENPTAIYFDEIAAAELLEFNEDTDFGTCENGVEEEDCMAGTYQNAAYGTYHLAINPKLDCAVLLYLKDGEIYLCNTQTAEITEHYFEQITESLYSKNE